jgi:hypothetical protein
LQGVVLVYACGNIFICDDKGVNEAGEIEGGVLAASWAPNQEYLALAST